VYNTSGLRYGVDDDGGDANYSSIEFRPSYTGDVFFVAKTYAGTGCLQSDVTAVSMDRPTWSLLITKKQFILNPCGFPRGLFFAAGGRYFGKGALQRDGKCSSRIWMRMRTSSEGRRFISLGFLMSRRVRPTPRLRIPPNP
jgi:hypothetical protein